MGASSNPVERAAEPTVTVVVPAYQAAGTLGEALGSVRGQTRAPDEVIVVDDGSTDDTGGVVLRDFPEYRLIRQGNAGPAAARNRGVREAHGTWLAFLDADDVWVPHKLETQLHAVRQSPEVAMWCARAWRYGQPAAYGAQDAAVPRGESGAAWTRTVAADEFLEHNVVVTSTVLMARAVFTALGGFDEALRGPEDYDLWMRVAAGYTMTWRSSPLAWYRDTPGRLSTDDRTFLPQVLKVLDKAYAAGGVFEGRPGRLAARAYHYLACSRMAADRGAVGRGTALLARSLFVWPWPIPERFRRLGQPRLKQWWYLLQAAARRMSPGSRCI